MSSALILGEGLANGLGVGVIPGPLPILVASEGSPRSHPPPSSRSSSYRDTGSGKSRSNPTSRGRRTPVLSSGGCDLTSGWIRNVVPRLGRAPRCGPGKERPCNTSSSCLLRVLGAPSLWSSGPRVLVPSPVDGVVAAPVAAAGELGAVWKSMIGLLQMGRPRNQPKGRPGSQPGSQLAAVTWRHEMAVGVGAGRSSRRVLSSWSGSCWWPGCWGRPSRAHHQHRP
jgi:hypothetical protein